MTAPPGVPADPNAGLFAAAGAVVASSIGGFALWVANRTMGKAAFQTALSDGFKKLLDATEADRDAAREEVRAIRKEFNTLRVKSEADRAQLHGQIASLQAVIDALQRQLRAAGVAVSQPKLSPGDPDSPMIVLGRDEETGGG